MPGRRLLLWRAAYVAHAELARVPARRAFSTVLMAADWLANPAQELQKDVQLELEAARKFLENIEGQASSGFLSWLPFKIPFLSK